MRALELPLNSNVDLKLLPVIEAINKSSLDKNRRALTLHPAAKWSICIHHRSTKNGLQQATYQRYQFLRSRGTAKTRHRLITCHP